MKTLKTVAKIVKKFQDYAKNKKTPQFTFRNDIIEWAVAESLTQHTQDIIEMIEGMKPTIPDVLISTESMFEHAFREGEHHMADAIQAKLRETLRE